MGLFFLKRQVTRTNMLQYYNDLQQSLFICSFHLENLLPVVSIWSEMQIAF